jgi:hypothetical protein
MRCRSPSISYNPDVEFFHKPSPVAMSRAGYARDVTGFGSVRNNKTTGQ